MFDFDFSQGLRLVAVAFVPALLGIILHEVAHGWMAERLGDNTAKMLGRLTLNPLPHIDPLGLAVFGLTSLSGSFVFGWAKPVPINAHNFRDPARGMMLVSLAGPLSNFFLAVFFALALWLTVNLLPFAEWRQNQVYIFALSAMQSGVVINFGLGWLNLLPIPPLDGSKILAYFLPPRLAFSYLGLERYGFLILILLLVTGALGWVLAPLVFNSSDGLFRLLGF